MSRCAYILPETGVRCLFEAASHSPYCGGCEALAFRDRTRFDHWMQEVVAAMDALCGLHPHDLLDCPYADWHITGRTPKEAARQCLARFLGEDDNA
jgi:hypothetical protein